MASKAEVICFLFSCFFVIGSATYCTYQSDCWYSETCCSDSVCRETCYYCSYDYQCGTGEECCNGDCLSACTSNITVWSGGVIAATIISTIVFFAIVISIVACFCCACCPYYRHRSPASTVQIAPDPGIQITTQTSAIQQMEQYPPPGNYNQPPQGYAQPPPLYPSYQQQPGQYPPPQAQGQPPIPQPVSAWEPVKY